MNYKKVNCPSCGARCENVDRFAAMAVCEYCGGGFYFQDEAVLAMGEMAILLEYPTPLYVGATGMLCRKRFTIAGRLRYRYSRGFWDEWYFRFDDGSDAWVAEDEMEFSLEEEEDIDGSIPPYEQADPGTELTLAGKQISVDERDVAKLEGAEGSIPFVLTKDTEFRYIDLSSGDATMTVEYAEEGPELYVGKPIAVTEIKLDNPKEDEAEGGWSDA